MTAAALDPALSGWTYYGENEGQPVYELVRGGVQIAVAQRDGEEDGKPRWYFEGVGWHVAILGGFPECARVAIEGDVAIAKEPEPIPFLGEPVYVDGDLADITIDF